MVNESNKNNNYNSSNKSITLDSKTSNVDAATMTGKHNNADLKHNNSGITNNPAAKNNNSDMKHNTSDLKSISDSKTNNVDAFLSQVYKSGPLFLSSKGIGWTSWKKRWFVLTQTSLVFFRSDPNAASQRGGEVNLALGGIDLNSSGSLVVKPDKKLLTVMFPDGRDGRAFTLKAETTEDINEWKAALEEALANAPSASQTTGQSGTLKNENGDTADASSENSKDRTLGNLKVLGRPILLALEDIDGTPSFLEKALEYVEDHGVQVEGILRQAADVEDVERRIQEYEQGKVEFTKEEDAHVIGDCIKYVLRELPSSPVPASCCNALLDAYRTDRSTRVSAMRAAICDTFPEPNRRLLQRMLIMMETVADNKNVNRMSVSAVAACMAPLLLRPLLAGECNLDSQFNMGGDGSAQLMQAAAAANHAQAIIITLLEEYDNIFGEGDMLSDLYSNSEELGSESEELSEYEDYSSEGSNEDSDHASTSSQSGGDGDSYMKNVKKPGPVRSRTIAHKATDDKTASKKLLSCSHVRSVSQVTENVSNQIFDDSTTKVFENVRRSEDDKIQGSKSRELTDNSQRSSTTADSQSAIQHTISQQTDAMTNLSSVDKEEAGVVSSEVTNEEAKAKAEAEDLLNTKKALETQRVQLEQDVARLKEQLRKELELRRKLETGIKISQQALFTQFSTINKAESDSSNQKTNDLEVQFINQENGKDYNDTTSQDSKDNHQLHSFSSRLPPHHQLDPSRSSKEKCSSKEGDDKHNLQTHSAKLPSSEQCGPTKDMKKSSSSRPKRLNSKNETVGTNSAMSKITNGLNFLKEKSNQLADELQVMNRDRNKSLSHKHVQKGSQEEFDIQSSAKESHPQHLDSHTDDQSTNVDREKSESLATDDQHDVDQQQR
uniref:rho GTPase-activating protein REN1-like n=1 Tax=Erigeron canadensis TaxID=72917 RepID=UPI001CB99E36|nr:rho GTPase-activating protein REN1-like [Erigeron canadensis]